VLKGAELSDVPLGAPIGPSAERALVDAPLLSFSDHEQMIHHG